MIAKYVKVLASLWNRIQERLMPKHLRSGDYYRNGSKGPSPLLTLHHRGSRFYFAVNLDPLGFWTEQELASLMYFIEQVHNGRLPEIAFPVLRQDAPELKERE